MATAERRPEFVLTYDGEALQAHRMAVADLAPALLALGEIFHEANEASDPNAPRVSLEIRAFDSGSFDVTLSLAQAGVGQDLLHFLTGQDTNALVNLIALVTGASGLFGVIVWIWRHRLSRQEPVAPGVTRFIAEDGTTLDIPSAVVELLQRPSVRRNARRVVAPLTGEGVDLLRFEPAGGEPLVVEAPETPAFDIAEAVERDLGIQNLTMGLTITTVSFAEGNKWRLSDGEHTFFATIKDEGFLRRVDARQEAFRKGDVLRCRVTLQQWQTETGLRPEWTVDQVLEHIPAGRNMTLPLGEPDESPPPASG